MTAVMNNAPLQSLCTAGRSFAAHLRYLRLRSGDPAPPCSVCVERRPSIHFHGLQKSLRSPFCESAHASRSHSVSSLFWLSGGSLGEFILARDKRLTDPGCSVWTSYHTRVRTRARSQTGMHTHTRVGTAVPEVAETPVFRREVTSPARMEPNNRRAVATMYNNL